jgi:adenylate cyclase
VRVVRCFAFLDLCGFTSYTEEHGDTKAVAVLSQLRAILRAEAENHGVRVTKWLGDGAMLSGVEARDVMACAVAVGERMAAEGELPLRGGVSEGPVIMFEGDDYIGDAVNRAARLCEVARPGQILVTEDTAPQAPDGAAGRRLPAVWAPGLSLPVDVRELVRVSAA